MIRINRFLAIFTLLCCIYPNIHAQWSSDPGVNTLVSGDINNQREAFIISDGNGGAFISWRDYRYTTSIFGGEIFAQRLNNEGITLWSENGIQVNASSMGKGHFRPQITGDGKGNALIAWARTPLSFYNYDLFAQKLDHAGNRSWPVNDVTVSDTSGTKSFQKVVSDDSCGMILTYTHLPFTPGVTGILAQRVDSMGNLKWQKNGVVICDADESQSNPELVGDGNGGAIIVWGDARNGPGVYDVYAQKVNSAGEIQWTVNGVALSNSTVNSTFPKIESDGEGGAIIIWEDKRSGNSDIYAQYLDQDGVSQWTAYGIAVCNAPGEQVSPDIVSDGMGGAIIVWQDSRNGNADIYAQRIDPSGQALWSTNGVAVSTVTNNQIQPVAMMDMAGGVIMTWIDSRTDAYGDIYAQRLNADGTALWTNNGVAICTASDMQEEPRLVSDGNMGAIITWSDRRGGTTYDIYAQNINKNGKLGILIDDDQDGIEDSEESGPNGDNPAYDGNSDGTADRLQQNVASFKTFDNSQYVTLAVPVPSVLEDVAAINKPAPDAAGAPVQGSYPYGFFSFSISGLSAGGSVVATLYLHSGPAVNSFYKYGPRPSQDAGWYEYDYDGGTGAEISGDEISLHFTDGIRGDSDLESNGTVVDPGGPLYASTSIETNVLAGFKLENIYPNPFGDQIDIVFSTVYNTKVAIEVFDLTGRLVCSLLEAQLPEGQHVVKWDAEGVNDGVYILKMNVGNQSFTRKIIKAR